jgi:hypothetical protein
MSSGFPIPDSRFPIPDSRFPIPDSKGISRLAHQGLMILESGIWNPIH